MAALIGRSGDSRPDTPPGRRAGVFARCLGGQPSEALEFLNKSALAEHWELPLQPALGWGEFREAARTIISGRG